jgi:hypothetical protein
MDGSHDRLNRRTRPIPVSRPQTPPAGRIAVVSLMVAAIIVTGRPSSGRRPK